LSRLLLPADVCERVINAQLADFQHEWASSSGAHYRALILARGYLSAWVVLISCAAGIRGVANEERRALLQVLTIFVLATAGMLALMVLPGLPHTPSHASAERLAAFQRVRWLAAFNAIPPALPLAVPVGFMVGALFGLRGPSVSHRVRRLVLLLAFACCVGAFVTLAWVTPLSERSFGIARAAAVGIDYYPKGAYEFTITELPQRAEMLQREGETRQSLRFLFHYHRRWSLACATLVLAILGLFVAERRTAVRLGLGVGACAIYYLLMGVTQSGGAIDLIPVVVLAWLPNVVVLGFAMAVRVRSSSATPA
jgi:lipopolysaccharide export LptBFGC system permease protein LptF